MVSGRIIPLLFYKNFLNIPLNARHHRGGEENPVVAFAKGGNSDESWGIIPVQNQIIPKSLGFVDGRKSQFAGDVAHSEDSKISPENMTYSPIIGCSKMFYMPVSIMGTVNQKMLPLPGVLDIPISPPINSTNRLATLRPNPQPVCSLTSGASERKNCVNSFS